MPIRYTIHFGKSGSFVVDKKTYDYFNKVKNSSKEYYELYLALKAKKNGL